MDYYTTTIRNKTSKIESSLLELNNEIYVGVKFLLSLKDDAAEIVRNLNNITTPATYLQEFMNVNSFILKYLSFLTEINCKFEILNISEKNFRSSVSRNKAITSTEVPESLFKLDSGFNCKGDLIKKTVKEKVIIDEPPSESDTNINHVDSLLTKKPKKKKSKKPLPIKSESISVNNNNVKGSTITNNTVTENTSDSVSEGNHIVNCNTHYASNVPSLNPEYIDITDMKSSDAKDDSHYIDHSEVSDDNNTKSNVIEILKIDGNAEQKSLPEMSCSPSVDFTHSFNKDEIVCSETCSNADIPTAEVVPIKIQDNTAEVFKELNSPNCPEEVLKTAQNSKHEEDEEGEEEEDCIQPEKLIRIVGKEYDVNIEHIKSPSEFYVSITGRPSSLLCELEKMLKLFTLNKAKTENKKYENKKVLLSKQIGTYALFYSKCDEIWCRVKITNWCLNIKEDFVTVFLLDYGETKCVSIDDLCPMPDYFKKYPTFIHRCHLHGIVPFEMDKNTDILYWEKVSTEKMKSLTEDSKTVRIKIAPDDNFHPPTSVPVTLWLADESNQCVNELLVKSKYAMWSSYKRAVKTEEKNTLIVENEKLKNWDPMKEDYESYLNSYDLDMNDPAAIIYGYVGKDYNRICKHFAEKGYCFKGIACKKEHQRLDPLGLTTDQEEVYKNAFNMLSIPPPKSMMNVQVTCLLKFNEFFCISENTSMPSFEENLQSLLKSMNSVQSVRDMKKLVVPPSTGQIVIARFSEDRCWYRGRILDSQPERDLYTVAFVDYGNKETMPLSNIRAIEPRYLHLPFQAMQCFIFGVDKNPCAPLKVVMDYMNDKISDGHVSIEIIASLPGEYINLLVNVFDQNGRNIGRDLIEKEYAIKKEEMIVSAESESVPG